ncbi:MAG: hypothetical protein A4E35_01044 [Methanoregula sp. PtaU1.Bin051]|nr:MAG: hypothetical protein A4E35_01044 [Methanoregula sp. PtaU1.Bin051]
MTDWPAVRKELTPERIVLAALYGIIVGISLSVVTEVFSRSRYMPVLFVLLFLILILAEFLWFHRSMMAGQSGPD